MKYNISFQAYFLKPYLKPEFHWNTYFLQVYFLRKGYKTF